MESSQDYFLYVEIFAKEGQRLPVNYEVEKRGIVSNSSCSLCAFGEEETADHLFFRCSATPYPGIGFSVSLHYHSMAVLGGFLSICHCTPGRNLE